MKLSHAIVLASGMVVALGGCVWEPNEEESTEFDEPESLGSSEQALSALPTAPTITLPANNALTSHSVTVKWSKLSDATDYRVQITQLNYFSGDTCTAPCDLNAVVSASSYCNATTCTAIVSIPGTGARTMRIRGGKPTAGGYWSSIRKFAVQ